jgi:hypothetical protein
MQDKRGYMWPGTLMPEMQLEATETHSANPWNEGRRPTAARRLFLGLRDDKAPKDVRRAH